MSRYCLLNRKADPFLLSIGQKGHASNSQPMELALNIKAMKALSIAIVCLGIICVFWQQFLEVKSRKTGS